MNPGCPILAPGSRQPYGPFELDKSWSAFTPAGRGPLHHSRSTWSTRPSRGLQGGRYHGEAADARSIQVPYHPPGRKVGNNAVLRRLSGGEPGGFVTKYDDLQVPHRFELDHGSLIDHF